MNIRNAFRAGSFYEETPTSCRHHAGKLLDSARLPDDLPVTLYGGIVPHAGWVYSGRLAAMTFKALDQAGPLETVVLLGADHTGAVAMAEVFNSGIWRTPLGDVPVDADLGGALVEMGTPFRANPEAHRHEHSIEVQVPLLAALRAGVKIVPVAVPPDAQAVETGRALGRLLAERFPRVRVAGSSDLTHHGGHFGSPGGHGSVGEQWTRQNDRRMIDRIVAMDAEAIVAEALRHENACGAGAIAATVAACREMGATKGVLLDYTNSYEVIHEMYPNTPDDTTVGYASIVLA
ncbi:MAG TPA: AmmeMemoRadiSam system protein B [Phycisphaerae bacterium]|nr:AmmeMemoRadiSam system protein B [Phycisphaerae bacterium]